MTSTFNSWYVIAPTLVVLAFIFGWFSIKLGKTTSKPTSVLPKALTMVLFGVFLALSWLTIAYLITVESFYGLVEYFGRDDGFAPIMAALTGPFMGFILAVVQAFAIDAGRDLHAAILARYQVNSRRPMRRESFCESVVNLVNRFDAWTSRVYKNAVAWMRAHRKVRFQSGDRKLVGFAYEFSIESKVFIDPFRVRELIDISKPGEYTVASKRRIVVKKGDETMTLRDTPALRDYLRRKFK